MLLGGGVIATLFALNNRSKANAAGDGPAVVTQLPNGLTTVTASDGLAATISPSTLPVQPLAPGKRQPTTLEIANSLSFIVVAPGHVPSADQVARQQAFLNSLPAPPPDFNAITDDQINAGLALMVSDAFNPLPGAGIDANAPLA